VIGTVDGYLIALNARTGRPIPTFGANGRLDLLKGVGSSEGRHLYAITSPPVICRDVIVVGSALTIPPDQHCIRPEGMSADSTLEQEKKFGRFTRFRKRRSRKRDMA